MGRDMKELLIEKKENILNIFLLENNELIETYEEDLNRPMIEDNIYIGKVQNVFNGMQAAFINVGIRKNVFIHLRDLLPKRDVLKNPSNESNKNITEFIKPGDPIVVQIMKDASNNKGARVTSHISIKGRYLIYMPEADFVTSSQKLDEENRRILKETVLKYLPEKDGAIIRTSAKIATEEELEKEINVLVKKWEEIKKIDVSKFPKLLYNAGGILGKYLIDIIDKSLDKIIVNNEEMKKILQENLDKLNVKINVEINENLLDRIGLEKQLNRAKNRKVWLKSGGFITIDKTEALTAIDVNTGKYTGTKNAEQTICKVNEEATIEIAKQLRLRDIGGIIIIDYIDMKDDENKKRVQELLEEKLKNDRTKTQVEGFTKLDLMEMTRKHICSHKE